MRSIARSTLPTLAFSALLALVGCGDALTEPEALLVAARTEAALQLSASLPTLPHLVGRALGPNGSDRRSNAAATETTALSRARALWLEAAGTGDAGAAAALREAAYALAASELAVILDSAAVADMHRLLDRWIRSATTLLGGAHYPQIEAALEQGRTLLKRARAAEVEGDRAAAVAALLEAADRLAETTPEGVALRLIREAEHLYGKRSTAKEDAPHDLSLSRAGRLLRGAREALGQRDYILAIRRAYYAGQLLRAGPGSP